MSYNLPPGLKYPLHFYMNKPWVKLGEPILLFERKRQTKRMDEVFAVQAAGVRSATR
jgi:hypothetical protein